MFRERLKIRRTVRKTGGNVAKNVRKFVCLSDWEKSAVIILNIYRNVHVNEVRVLFVIKLPTH